MALGLYLLRAKEKIENIESSSLRAARSKLTGIEGKFTESYFKQIFQLLPAMLRPEKRRSFKAYDGLNNIFNLAYCLGKFIGL